MKIEHPSLTSPQTAPRAGGNEPFSLSGFTLVELLVVITIIAVLATLAYPNYTAAVQRSYQAATAQNLRTVGSAIQLYANENNGTMPGPFYSAINGRYKKDDGSIGSQLFSYLGAPEPQAQIQEAKVLTNPGHLRYRPAPDSFVYLLNVTLYLANYQPLKPFGYPATASSTTTDPANILALLKYKPSQTWALQDADQQNTNLPGTPSWKSSLPKKPVNGNVRMTMFFDWHVEPVKADPATP